jgi:hypothetical protein
LSAVISPNTNFAHDSSRATERVMAYANLVTVRVEKPTTVSFGRTMNEIRTWLDHRKIQPIEFRPVPAYYGFGFQISFGSEEDAQLFQRDFER